MIDVDKEYWKKRYKDKWEVGNKREKIFKDLFEKWGYTVKKFGFEALSNEYNPKSPNEKGKPDFFVEINKKEVFFEVTGTDVLSVKPEADIWLRPDKVEYINNHNLRCFCVHILSSIDLIRFIDMNIINKENCPLIFPIIRGAKETYHSINSNVAKSKDEFKTILDENKI